MTRCLLVACLAFGVAGQVEGQSGAPRDTIYVADRFLGESTIGAVVVAKFDNPKIRAETLRLDAPVLTVNGREWVLGYVLVKADFDGNGYIAIWTIAGPKAVVDAHTAAILAMTKDRTKIYDHGIRRVVVRCACD